jgi:hypothetical protein
MSKVVSNLALVIWLCSTIHVEAKAAHFPSLLNSTHALLFEELGEESSSGWQPMIDRAKYIALICVIIFIFWLAMQPHAVFYISVRNGQAKVHKGSPPVAFLQDLKSELEKCNVKKATIRGVRLRGRIAIQTSGLSAATQQHIRNLWRLYDLK